MKFSLLLSVTLLIFSQSSAQNILKVRVSENNGDPIPYAVVNIKENSNSSLTNDNGEVDFKLSSGKYTLEIKQVGYETYIRKVEVSSSRRINIILQQKNSMLSEVVVSGSMKEMSKSDSPIPIESYQPSFFRKAAVSNLLDATQQITGLRPQLNCSVCNTGDIHLNGMEGPYTAVLIDGMPIVSSLSTVYGLSGIPLSIIERVEVIKGPAGSLYGSEAMAGVINVITKDPLKANLLSVESSVSSHREFTNDVTLRWKVNPKLSALFSLHNFNYGDIRDVNNDSFTDFALQNRYSLFSKIKYNRESQSPVQIGLRLYHEDRWGGQTNWAEKFRGTDSIYGEAVNTDRLEFLSSFSLFKKNPVEFQTSYVFHQQKSTYGLVNFNAVQHTVFLQSIYRMQLKNHQLMTGLSLKTNLYDDNTILTRSSVDTTQTLRRDEVVPGVFFQDDIKVNAKINALLALRADYHSAHDLILSPRASFQYKLSTATQFRIGAGRGFRIVNVFTEDHAALTGDRKVILAEELKPESSVNSFLAVDHFYFFGEAYLKTELNLFYTYFFNRINADYDSSPNEIIYRNLNGEGVSRGVNGKIELQTAGNWNMQTGFTILDAYEKRNDSLSEKKSIMFSSLFSGNVNVTYNFAKIRTKIDYNIAYYSPMRLPVLPEDYRPEYSPWYALHNIQATRAFGSNWELYAAVKNIFNFLPADPLMRPFDPFDKNVNVNNPNGYTFDTTYGYAPMQGRRLLMGLRYQL